MSRYKCLLTMAVVITIVKAMEAMEYQFSEHKRSVNCSPIYSFIPGHSACLRPSPHVRAAGVTDAEKVLIVREHNKYRSGANPTAEDMIKLYWDEQVAQVAQSYAENCEFTHDKNWHRYIPGKFNCGQNLAKSTVKSPWENMVRMWYDEIKYFTYGAQNNHQKTGHYSGMMSALKTRIGCGYADCGSEIGHIFVCNYGPPGHFGNTPYTKGPSCKQCPKHCHNNLCDCKGKVCLNGGTLDLNTCTCQCRRSLPHYVGDDCRLNCSLLHDPWQCGTGTWKPSKCSVFSNLPYDCVGMCGICPYGGVDYLKYGAGHHATPKVDGAHKTTNKHTSERIYTDTHWPTGSLHTTLTTHKTTHRPPHTTNRMIISTNRGSHTTHRRHIPTHRTTPGVAAIFGR